MHHISLHGDWTLRDGENTFAIPAKLPGCNYLDLMAAGRLADPFWELNEREASRVAEKDYHYTRDFSIPAECLAHQNVDLVISGLDTLATITLNGEEIAQTNNCHRTYRLSIKHLARETGNTLSLHIASPIPYLAQKQAEDPIFSIAGGARGLGHLRKVQCHFGWDWGPNLPPAGVFGDIRLECYDIRLRDVTVRQRHGEGIVRLRVLPMTSGDSGGLSVRFRLTAPDGRVTERTAPLSHSPVEIAVQEPKLWWPNGLGGQPLYDLSVQLLSNAQTVLDAWERRIGLRSIRLNTALDAHGGQFRFFVNGIPIFAKGANWIPTDTFITRTTRDDLRFYIESARRANMNMLRVWGGGHYESDAFYDLCDENGLLVWQDFAFACSAYPFYDDAFMETVRHEVEDNVARLRHHASLALWCGNNENELFAMLWKRNKRTLESNLGFYYDALRGWVNLLDPETPYWPGSPSSGSRNIRAASIHHGDSHLWQVWHGLMPIERFRRMPARFCSEYGLESFPSMRAIRSFTDRTDISYLDPVMLGHQKSAGGNQKILFYLMAKFPNPAGFEDFVYLSQLTQSGAIRFATDEWRRNTGRCNGSLYWQYNDCWPVASWSGVDYLGQLKALQYHARHFNKPLCLSNDYYKDRAELYCANDTAVAYAAMAQWELMDFEGNEISSGEQAVSVAALGASRLLTLPYAEILKGRQKEEAVLSVRLAAGGAILDEKNWLLVPDKRARLPKARVEARCEVKGGMAEITLASPMFARYVYVEVEGVTAPLSDNFFDLLPGRPVIVTVPAPDGFGAEELRAGLRTRSLADVVPKAGPLADAFQRFGMRFTKVNLLTWMVFKLFLRTK